MRLRQDKRAEVYPSRKIRSFYDNMMAAVGIPLIISWLVFACYVIYKGVNDTEGLVQQNLDFFVSLIAIIGGPALLFLTAVLDAWKTEGQAEMAAIPARIDADLIASAAQRDHSYKVEMVNLEHQNTMAQLAQAHNFKMEERSGVSISDVKKEASTKKK